MTSGLDLALVGLQPPPREVSWSPNMRPTYRTPGFLIATGRASSPDPGRPQDRDLRSSHRGRIAIHIISGASDASRRATAISRQAGAAIAAPRIHEVKARLDSRSGSTSAASSTRSRAKSDVQPFQKRIRCCSSAARRTARWRWVQALRRVRHVRRALAPQAAHRRVPRQADAFGRNPLHMSFRPSSAPRKTRWDWRANLASVQKPAIHRLRQRQEAARPVARRLLDFAPRGDQRQRLWLPIAEDGRPWATPRAWSHAEQVARPCWNTHSASTRPVRGFDPFEDHRYRRS